MGKKRMPKAKPDEFAGILLAGSLVMMVEDAKEIVAGNSRALDMKIDGGQLIVQLANIGATEVEKASAILPHELRAEVLAAVFEFEQRVVLGEKEAFASWHGTIDPKAEVAEAAMRAAFQDALKHCGDTLIRLAARCRAWWRMATPVSVITPPVKRGRPKSIEDDLKLLANWKSSGLSKAEFARQRGGDPSTLGKAIDRAEEFLKEAGTNPPKE